jgi:branched-chain amino acid transport system substrate-binding protein
VGDRLGGFQAEIVPLDHRGNSRRSLRHLETFARDDRALALFAGLHSPPLLENRDYINRNEILVLDPWAAAGPITRPPEGENWIFRLSIDDARAGYVIAREAVAEGFRRPYLLLEDTGWGKSNETTMTRALAELGVEPVGVEWFNWNLGATGARIILRKIADTGADVQ